MSILAHFHGLMLFVNRPMWDLLMLLMHLCDETIFHQFFVSPDVFRQVQKQTFYCKITLFFRFFVVMFIQFFVSNVDKWTWMFFPFSYIFPMKFKLSVENCFRIPMVVVKIFLFGGFKMIQVIFKPKKLRSLNFNLWLLFNFNWCQKALWIAYMLPSLKIYLNLFQVNILVFRWLVLANEYQIAVIWHIF